MSDYRRFVAYLYEYPNHQKGPNRGSVRVEARNGMCRMDFQMQGTGQHAENAAKVQVYGFIRRNGALQGILLGTLTAGRNRIIGRIVTATEHFADSPYTLADLGGLILVQNPSRIYATEWDDQSIDTRTFITPETNIPTDETAPEKNIPSEQDGSLPQNTSFDESTQPKAGTASVQSILTTETSRSGHDVLPESDTLPNPNTRSVQTLSPAPGFQSASSLPQGEEIHIASVEAAPPARNTPAAVMLPRRAATPSGWKHLQDLLPHFQPFPDDLLTECLRIEYKDLPLLRREGFPADSNPFLLHGYQNYRHLLLARDSGMENAYIFGIPGVYTVNEQFMAGLFGYRSFRQANRPKGNAPEGLYGYWFRYVTS